MRRRLRSAGREKRASAERAGRLAEALAGMYLRAIGYRLVARRFKCPVGEIDLIAEKGGNLVFVEVKSRRHSAELGSALEAVNRRRIYRAASYFLMRRGQDRNLTIRFDVIFLASWRLPIHLRNAFDGTGLE